MFARLISSWDHPHADAKKTPKTLPPYIKEYKLAQAKKRKQKRKSGGPK